MNPRAQAFLGEHWPRVVLSLILLVVFFGNQGFRGLVKNYLELRGLNKQISALEAQERMMSERLKQGDTAIERMARKELGYVRKGEIEYRFPPPAPEAK